MRLGILIFAKLLLPVTLLVQTCAAQTCTMATPELPIGDNTGKTTNKSVPVGDPVYSKLARETGGMVMAGKPSELGDNFAIGLAHEMNGNKKLLHSSRFQMGEDSTQKDFVVHDAQKLSVVISVMEHDGLYAFVSDPNRNEISSKTEGVNVKSTAAGCLVSIDAPKNGQWSVRLFGSGEVKLTIYTQ